MCVRCGTGRIAWCTSPDRHASEEKAIMDDLTAFISARLSEDEAMAKRNSDGRGLADGFPDYRTYSGPDQLAADEYIDHFGPARVLREVTAKRAIVADHAPSEVAPDACRRCKGGMASPCRTLRAIAAVWSDHPDYPEWAPGHED